ncbi:hypothetical protein [Palleronia caenipelagi]|uniref:hypothetical protein n=1 Tax=Palleronia caenipelagi TaxID=2489174 RepID=UPI00163D4648|nr:hypothetical protein [Palleronia caenipelagi]
MTGTRTPDLTSATTVAELIGNYDGSTVRIPMDRVAAMLSGLIGPSFEFKANLNAALN